MFKISLQVLFCDKDSTLKSFNLDIKGGRKAGTKSQISVSLVEGNFETCYSKNFIKNVAFAQSLVNSIVNGAIKMGPAGSAPIKTSSYQIYANYEYMHWKKAQAAQ
jgi:hypothetical protein